MYACVRSSRAVQKNSFLRHTLEHIFDFPLNGRLVRLHLPAVEIRAPVGAGELDIPPGRRRRSAPAYAPRRRRDRTPLQPVPTPPPTDASARARRTPSVTRS